MPKHDSALAATDPAKGSSLMSIKMAQKAREEDEKIKLKRRRGVIVMVMQFLQEHGLHRSFEALQAESNISLSKFPPADNMDMNTIFAEYEDFFELKFGKKPKFFRVPGDGAGGGGEGAVDAASLAAAAAAGERTKAAANSGGSSSTTTPPVPPATSMSGKKMSAAASAAGGGGGMMMNRPPIHPDSGPASADRSNNNNNGNGIAASLDVRGIASSGASVAPQRPLRGGAHNAARNGIPCSSDDDAGGAGGGIGDFNSLPGFQGRSALMKPLPRFPSTELNEIAGMIHREILDRDPGVSFNDIAELDSAKQLLKEAIVMPVKYPQFFTGLLRPWNGILMFGPSGTGKTLLAKAVATECRTTFFNVSASTIVSKWRGDSEKLVRMLFELAVHFAPSTIFIDELDSVLSARASDGSEHEASRRMKTEFLIQMDGLAKRDKGEVVFVMAASNLPWDLDAAVLRRLEKRIMVGLPSALGREVMFRRLLSNTKSDFDFKKCAEITEGYSGADIDILCREAMMRSVRVLINKLEATSSNQHHQLSAAEIPKVPLVTVDDVIGSSHATRASVQAVPMQKYVEWEKKFGSTMSS